MRLSGDVLSEGVPKCGVPRERSRLVMMIWVSLASKWPLESLRLDGIT